MAKGRTQEKQCKNCQHTEMVDVNDMKAVMSPMRLLVTLIIALVLTAVLGYFLIYRGVEVGSGSYSIISAGIMALPMSGYIYLAAQERQSIRYFNVIKR